MKPISPEGINRDHHGHPETIPESDPSSVESSAHTSPGTLLSFKILV
jgi:hypothetical protein